MKRRHLVRGQFRRRKSVRKDWHRLESARYSWSRECGRKEMACSIIFRLMIWTDLWWRVKRNMRIWMRRLGMAKIILPIVAIHSSSFSSIQITTICLLPRIGKISTKFNPNTLFNNKLYSYLYHSYGIYFSSLTSTYRWFTKCSFLLRVIKGGSRVRIRRLPCRRLISKASYKTLILRNFIEYMRMILLIVSKGLINFCFSWLSTGTVLFLCLQAGLDWLNCPNTMYLSSLSVFNMHINSNLFI